MSGGNELIKLIDKTYEDFKNAPGGESWCVIDDKEYHSDMGYAFEGIDMFVDVLKSRIEDSNGEKQIVVYNQENTPGLRDRFVDDVTTVFSSAKAFLDFIEDGKYSSRYDAFLDYNYDSETYIINRETGKYINWYKASHIGRDIHTNVEPDKIKEFLKEFKEDSDE